MPSLATAMPVSAARKNLYDIVDETVNKLRRFIITHRNGGSITVLPTEEVEGLEETIEIMGNKRLVRSIAEGLKDIKRGKIKSLDEIEKQLSSS